MFNDFKSRLVVILLIIGVACYFLVPTYNKYVVGSEYKTAFNSPSMPIPIGAGILLKSNQTINKECLESIEFYSDSKHDSIEALLLNDSKQLTYSWGKVEINQNNEIDDLPF